MKEIVALLLALACGPAGARGLCDPGGARSQDLRQDPLYQEAAERYAAGDRDAAARAFEQLAQRPGTSGEDCYAIASFYFAVRDWKACLPYATRSCEGLPDAPQAAVMLGVCLLYTGGEQQAVRRLTEATQTFPGDAALHYNLGLAHARLEKPLEAGACYLRALELRPDEPLFLFTAGENAMLLLRTEEALRRFQAAAMVEQPHPLAACRAATALADLGRPEEARTWFQKGLDSVKGPARSEIQFHYGVYLYDLGRHELALKRFDLAIRGNPRYRLAWQYRARCLRALGRMEEALEAVQRYRELQQDEDDLEEQYLLSILAQQLGIELATGTRGGEAQDGDGGDDDDSGGDGHGDGGTLAPDDARGNRS